MTSWNDTRSFLRYPKISEEHYENTWYINQQGTKPPSCIESFVHVSEFLYLNTKFYAFVPLGPALLNASGAQYTIALNLPS